MTHHRTSIVVDVTQIGEDTLSRWARIDPSQAQWSADVSQIRLEIAASWARMLPLSVRANSGLVWKRCQHERFTLGSLSDHYCVSLSELESLGCTDYTFTAIEEPQEFASVVITANTHGEMHRAVSHPMHPGMWMVPGSDGSPLTLSWEALCQIATPIDVLS